MNIRESKLARLVGLNTRPETRRSREGGNLAAVPKDTPNPLTPTLPEDTPNPLILSLSKERA